MQHTMKGGRKTSFEVGIPGQGTFLRRVGVDDDFGVDTPFAGRIMLDSGILAAGKKAKAEVAGITQTQWTGYRFCET